MRGKTWEPATYQLLTLQYQYDALLSASQKQAETMRKVATSLRNGPFGPGDDHYEWANELADELDPIEPVAEADAAEKFSQDCARRRVEPE